MAITKRERTLLVGTISAVVLSATILLIRPLTRQWQDVRGQLGIQLRERDVKLAKIQRAPEWKAALTKLRGGIEHTPVRYEKTTDVLKRIEELVQSTGVIMITEKPMQEQDKGVYRELPVQCTIESTTESLVKFLQALQSGSGFLTVEQLQVTLKPDNTNVLRCDIQIRALASKSEAPPA